MALSIGDNFSYLGAKPLDGRETYATKADLTAVSLSTVYEGMVAYVKSEDKYYRLKGTTWVEFSSGGGGISTWTANTAYVVNDVVINSNKMYICTTAHTSGSSFDATEKANWQEVGSGTSGAGITDWVSNKAYVVGDIVYYSESLFKCNTAHTSGSAFNADEAKWTLMYADIKLWQSSLYYVVGATVLESNVLYRCNTSHTSGSTFNATEKANWDTIGEPASILEWEASTAYTVNQIVIYNGNLYNCITAHTSGSTFDPVEELNWELLGRPNITDWATSYNYQVDDMVIYANSIYRCVAQHTSDNTNFSTDITNWELVYADLKEWVSGDYYTLGTCVVDSDRYIWRCTTAHTAGLAFDPTEQANWEMIGGDPDSLTSAQIAALIANFNPAGNGLMQLDNWEASHGYTVKQVVLYNNKMYRCKTAHTSGTTFDATEQANWDEIVGSGGGASISAWTSGGNYAVGDFVIYHNKIYQCKTANADTTFTPANWQEIGGIADYASGVSYMVGELVFNGTKLCRCKVAHTSTATFDDTKWDIIAGARTNIEAWASSTKYSVGEVVVRENSIYRCKTAHTSSSAFSTDIANWTKLDNIPDWASSKAYFVDDLVIYSNNVYKCVTAHTSASTFDKSKWQILGMTVTAPIAVGEVGFVSWQYALMTDNLALDGSTINNFSANYPELYNFFNTNGVLTTTLATYTANKSLCYYDATNDAATMPDFLNKTVWGGSTIAEKKAGLPNITGTWSSHIPANAVNSGATRLASTGNAGVAGGASDTKYSYTIDASRSSSIYGNSTTVQPPAIQLIPQIRYRKEVVEGSFEEYGNSPIGTIISYMGNTPPVEYLACDGTTYNITDYWELAEFIKTEFGSYNYFGGDGTTTFAVPDLRGEFLRGTGTNSHTNQGSGGNVGTHQDATEHNVFVTSAIAGNELRIRGVNGSSYEQLDNINRDSSISTTKQQTYKSQSTTAETVNADGTYTSRPTNTSVLYCIKYTNSLIMQPANVYSTTEKRIGTWIDGKPLYQCTFTGTTPSSNTSQGLFANVSSYNIDKCISIDGNIQRNDGVSFSVNIALSTQRMISVYMQNSNTDIYMNLSGSSVSDLLSQTAYITIKYTKS